MDATAPTQDLAKQLSLSFLRAKLYPESDSRHDEVYRLRAARLLTENDRVARAIEVEFGELFQNNTALHQSVNTAVSRCGRRKLLECVDRSLRDRPHTCAALLALTQSALDDGREGDGNVAESRSFAEWLRRNVALGMLQILILTPLVIAYFAVWNDETRHTGEEPVGIALLKVFLVWVLSFVPSWLYIRFLGQRAGALWNEYVIHLHRLAVDEPRYLPRPPRSSEFYQEWIADRGYLQDEEGNIYRQKFNAYYGRAVSSARGRDFVVKTETLFPVMLTAVIFSTCWTATLADTNFLKDPHTVWDALKFGFFGAYAFTFQSLIRRYFQSDLRPSAYASAVLRLVVVFTTVATLFQILDPVERGGGGAAVAFVVGSFPIVGIYALHRTAAVTLRAAVPQLTPKYPLNQIDGLNVWYESRLVEEGIEDMQSLVTANLVDVMLHTRVPLARLVDWIDQATLYLHLDHSEITRGQERRAWSRGVLPRRRRPECRGVTLEQLERARLQVAPAAAKAPESGAKAPAESVDRVGGSVGKTVRAGTRTRIELRQLGIRTATDLLVAFPPAQIDPRTPTEAPLRAFACLVPKGIDVEQIRLLARVLDEDADLVPVWNWHRRGARVRPPRRAPHRAMTVRRPPDAPGPVPFTVGSGR
ncbi:hypothetical protein [Nocardia bovistercoris]|uniref:Uncharacterized protein n=1 Tax=Nocardia bovistercoris TaxID=2785916 RepID=A0A931IAN7_9NOCA|nr:hypothetical protein [Nocardia bovistercoris]MBH0777944.1 hypothetical protein [Nocardia bovistercoris]